MRRIAIAMAGAAIVADPLSAAAPFIFSGTFDLRAGYGANPFLQRVSEGASPLIGGTVNATLSRREERSTTSLNAIADIEQNFQHYGRAENYIATLERFQQLTRALSADILASYQDTINARNYSDIDTSNIDLLSVGQRTRRISVNGQLDWQATRRDSFRIGGNFSHATYAAVGASDFTQYGLTGGYLRTISARTKVGVQLTATQVQSQRQPSTRSYQSNLQLVQQLSAIWTFDGSVGLILEKTNGGLSASSKTIGFNASLCGTYPQYDVCFRASRQSAPSGFGGLRTDTQLGADAHYKLSPRSRLGLSGTYDDSRSPAGATLPRQRYYQVAGSYNRDIGNRLSAGLSGRYQRRDFGSLPLIGGTASGYALTLDVTYKFGHLGS